MDQQIARADAAYRRLDANHVIEYNNAVASIVREIDGETPNELRTQLVSIHVELDQSKIELPLVRYRLVSRSRMTNEFAGIPILLARIPTRNAGRWGFFAWSCSVRSAAVTGKH